MMKAVKLCAILSITWLETLNLFYFGYNGAVLTAAIAAIAGIAGYEIGALKKQKRRKRKKSKMVSFSPVPNDI